MPGRRSSCAAAELACRQSPGILLSSQHTKTDHHGPHRQAPGHSRPRQRRRPQRPLEETGIHPRDSRRIPEKTLHRQLERQGQPGFPERRGDDQSVVRRRKPGIQRQVVHRREGLESRED